MSRLLCTGCFLRLPRWMFKTVPDGWHKAGSPACRCRICCTQNPIRFRPYTSDTGIRKLEAITITKWQRFKEFFHR